MSKTFVLLQLRFCVLGLQYEIEKQAVLSSDVRKVWVGAFCRSEILTHWAEEGCLIGDHGPLGVKRALWTLLIMFRESAMKQMLYK